MFGINLFIVLLIASLVAMGTCHKLPDTPQAAPVISGISRPDADIMAVVEQLKVKIMNMEENYDDTLNEIKKHYDGEIQEIKKHYNGEILELKNTQTTKLRSNEAAIRELKERHDEMKSSLDDMKSMHDVEILELKESYHMIKMKYDHISKGKEIETSLNQAYGTLYPNDLHKDRVDKNRNKSELKADLHTEITSPLQKSDASVDAAKGRNNNENQTKTTNTESEQLKQLLEMSGHNLIDLNAGEGQAAGFSAFQVYMSAAYGGNLNDILVFDDVQINIGGGYDAALGTFTAPTAGLYIINRSHMADPSCGTSHTCTELIVNGVYISHTCSVNPTSTAKTELVQLATGDNVWLQISGGCTSFNGNNYNSFSVYLLIENI